MKIIILEDINLGIEDFCWCGGWRGKSILFHIMLGLLQPNSGNLFLK